MLNAVRGMVVICTYPDARYDEWYAGWGRVELRARADGAAARTEVLYISPNAGRVGLFA